MKFKYVVRRSVKATDKLGLPCRIAMAFIEFENGYQMTHAIPEAKIAAQGPLGPSFIEQSILAKCRELVATAEVEASLANAGRAG